MEDLNAASLADVKDWFKTYYGPANAVLVIAGDVKTDDIRQRVERYFEDIPSGPPLAKHQSWPAKMIGDHRQVMQDRVPQSRLFKIWNLPEFANPDEVYLAMAFDILGSGKSSRLYKRLVYKDRIASDVDADHHWPVAAAHIMKRNAVHGLGFGLKARRDDQSRVGRGRSARGRRRAVAGDDARQHQHKAGRYRNAQHPPYPARLVDVNSQRAFQVCPSSVRSQKWRVTLPSALASMRTRSERPVKVQTPSFTSPT